jgi:hypothetical protein
MWLVNGLASLTSASNGKAESSNATKLVEIIFFTGLIIVMAIGFIPAFPICFLPATGAGLFCDFLPAP